MLLRLAGESDGGAVVRRRVPLAELDAESRPEVAAVLARLADRRLLTVGDGAVEVAHEALLREWPRLRGWLDEDVAGSAPAPPDHRRRRAPGTPTGATRPSCIAARG